MNVHSPWKRSDRAGIRDVASAAGVSISTVSKALNHPETVSALMAKRIALTAQSLGYRPSSAARALRGARSGLVGLVLDRRETDSRFIRGASKVLVGAGFEFLVWDVSLGLTPAKPLALMDRLHVEGALVSAVDVAHELAGIDFSVVLVDPPGAHVGAGIVNHDDRRAGATAVEHALSTGSSHLVYVFDHGTERELQRWSGAQSTAARAGVAILRVDPIARNRIGFLPQAVLRGGRSRTTVIAASDAVGRDVIHALLAGGVRVPEEVAVIGYGDIDAANCAVPMTSICPPSYSLGRQAARMLISAIAGPYEAAPAADDRDDVTPARYRLVMRGSSSTNQSDAGFRRSSLP